MAEGKKPRRDTGRPKRVVPRVPVALNLDPLVPLDSAIIQAVQEIVREQMLPQGAPLSLRAGVMQLLKEAILQRRQNEEAGEAIQMKRPSEFKPVEVVQDPPVSRNRVDSTESNEVVSSRDATHSEIGSFFEPVSRGGSAEDYSAEPASEEKASSWVDELASEKPQRAPSALLNLGVRAVPRPGGR